MHLAASLALVLVLPTLTFADPPGELVQPRDGHFRIRFPGKPKENTQSAKTEIGTLKVYTATFALADGSVFLASFTEFPADKIKPETHATLLDGARDGLKGKDGTVVSDKSIEVGPDKVPAKEIKIDKGKQQTRFRLLVKDNRLIQHATVGTGDFVTGKEATAFLDSFELTD